jgi:hypothetical protein
LFDEPVLRANHCIYDGHSLVELWVVFLCAF